MTLNFRDRQLKLVQDIMGLVDEQSLIKLEQQIELLKKTEGKKDKFWAAIRPIKRSNTIAEMIEEQGYKPITKNTFYKKVAKLNINEPLEDLLSMLSK